MVIFIEKVKTKTGLNNIDLDKIRRSVPGTHKVISNTPEITFTANHVIVAFKCEANNRPIKAVGKKAKTKKAK